MVALAAYFGLDSGQISLKKAQETIGREIFWQLPNDYRTMVEVRNNGVPLIEHLSKLGGKHGVGRIDHVENRLVGIKSRELYEAPAAVILHLAHRELESLRLRQRPALARAPRRRARLLGRDRAGVRVPRAARHRACRADGDVRGRALEQPDDLIGGQLRVGAEQQCRRGRHLRRGEGRALRLTVLLCLLPPS